MEKRRRRPLSLSPLPPFPFCPSALPSPSPPFVAPFYSFFILFSPFLAALGGREEECAPLKSKSRRKGGTEEEGRREENRALRITRSTLTRQDPRCGVRATLFAGGRGTRLRIRFLGIPRRPLNGTFLAHVCFRMAHHLPWDSLCACAHIYVPIHRDC